MLQRDPIAEFDVYSEGSSNSSPPTCLVVPTSSYCSYRAVTNDHIGNHNIKIPKCESFDVFCYSIMTLWLDKI